jgi:hypothetical protein
MKIDKKYIKGVFILLLWWLIWSVSFWLYFFKTDNFTQAIVKCTNYPSDINNIDTLIEYAYENQINIKGKYNKSYTIWCFPWLDSWSFEIIWESRFARDKNNYFDFSYYWKWTNRVIIIKKKLEMIDRESFQIDNRYLSGNANKNYWIVSDKNAVYFYNTNLEIIENIDSETLEFIKKWNYDRTLSKIYFQDKNWLYFSELQYDGIYLKKVLDTPIVISNINYYSPTILDTGKQIIREGKILDYVDYETLIWIWSVQEYQKDKKNVYDKNFDIIPNLIPNRVIDLWYENKYYISDGNYFYLIWERETENFNWFEYENVISKERTTQLIDMYNQMKSFYDNWGY